MTDDPHRFEFDLDRGIRVQVIEKLEASPLLPLAEGVGPRSSGIYALYFRSDLVYVGKVSTELTKSERTLRARLAEHRGKLKGRQNITPSDVQCRFLTFTSEWWVVAAEMALIETYSPKWNGSGFGSKTPGKGRPGTHRISPWDSWFPPR